MNRPPPPPPGASRTPRQVGQGMLWLSAVGALALLTWFFSGALENQRNPNRSVEGELTGGVRQVTLEANRQHHFLARGEINGQEVEFLVDTGATQVAVSRGVAERLGLPRGRTSVVGTANGPARVATTRLASVKLGNIELRDVPGVIVPNMGGSQVLLGMSFLRDLEMTQRDGRLILRQPFDAASR